MVSSDRLFLLDTNMITYLVATDSEDVQRRYLQTEGTSRIGISAVTEGEIRYGLAKKPEANKLNGYMQRFLDRTETLPWDSTVTRTYGTLRARLQALGMLPGPLDLMIAAHALALDATLVTHDRALKRLHAFVTVEDWVREAV